MKKFRTSQRSARITFDVFKIRMSSKPFSILYSHKVSTPDLWTLWSYSSIQLISKRTRTNGIQKENHSLYYRYSYFLKVCNLIKLIGWFRIDKRNRIHEVWTWEIALYFLVLETNERFSPLHLKDNDIVYHQSNATARSFDLSLLTMPDMLRTARHMEYCIRSTCSIKPSRITKQKRHLKRRAFHLIS